MYRVDLTDIELGHIPHEFLAFDICSSLFGSKKHFWHIFTVYKLGFKLCDIWHVPINIWPWLMSLQFGYYM